MVSLQQETYNKSKLPCKLFRHSLLYKKRVQQNEKLQPLMYVVQTFIFKPLKRTPHSPPNFANKISKKIAQSKEKKQFLLNRERFNHI